MFLYAVVFQLVALMRGKSLNTNALLSTVELVTPSEFLQQINFSFLLTAVRTEVC